MIRRIQDKLIARFMMASLITAAMFLLVYRNSQSRIESDASVVQTLQVLRELEGTSSLGVDLETGVRGFAITGKEEYLEPYLRARIQIPEQLRRLRQSMADNVSQRDRLAELERLIASQLRFREGVTRLTREQGVEAGRQALGTGQGKAGMDAIRRLTAEMEEEARRLLHQRQQQGASADRTMVWELPGLGGLIAAVLVSSYRQIRKHLAERMRVEAVLQEREEKLAVTLRSIGDGVLATDAEGRVLGLNPEAERLTGWTEEEASGRPVEQVFRILNEQTRQPVEVPVEKVLATGQTIGLANHTVLVARDGSECPIADSAAPIRDPEGNILGVVLVFRDAAVERRAEQALRASEERYRQVTESAPFGLAIQCEGRFVYMNPAGLAMFGANSAECITGKPILDFVDASDQEAIKERIARLNLNRISAPPRETQFRRVDGTLWCGEATANPLTYQGKPGAVVIFQDTSRRKAAEIAAEERELQLRTISANLPDGAVFQAVQAKAGTSHRFTYMSPGIEALTGLSADDILSGAAPLRPFLADNNWEVISEDIGRAAERMVPLHLEIRFRFTSGAVKWLYFRAMPRRRTDGDIQWDGVVLDVTGRKADEEELLRLNTDLEQRVAARTADLRESERSLRDAEARLRFALECTGTGAWDLDLEDHSAYRTLQHDCIFGYTELLPNWTYEMFLDHVLPADRDAVDEAFRHATETGSAWGFECRIRRTDGEVRWIWASGRPLVAHSQGRDRRRLAGIVQDITERKRLEEEYLQAQKMETVGRLAGGVAHDFNNLLTVINGYGDLALNKLDDRDPMHENLTEIRKSGDRAAELTQQLLAFSRRQIVEAKVLDLNLVVQDTEKMLRRVVGEDVELATALEPELWSMTADKGQLTQVLMNLAVNARDAMPNGGHLLIETANVVIDEYFAREHYEIAPGRYVQLAVSDSGTGMDAETKGRIFEPFFTTKKIGEGTGLGLATVYGIVKQAGGSIYVYSEVGQGTIFKIYFPRVDESPRAEESTAILGTLSGGETILLVEDQTELRKLAELVLKGYGYKVLGTASGNEALLKAEKYYEPIHLLLTDVILPGMNGREVAERLQRQRPDMKVLYMSGYSEDVIAYRGILKEGVKFLPKPFTPTGLARKVKEVLGSAKLLGTILVVDDEPGIRGFLREVLEGAGYKVLDAEDGNQAIAQAAVADLDLVITDLVMPEQEGLETIKLLRKQRPGLKIIAISGAFQGMFLDVAEKLGAEAVLSKPIRPGDLLEVLQEVLKK